jgi:hypothetical protein
MGGALTAGRSAAEAVAPKATRVAQHKTIIFEEEFSWLICLTMQIADMFCMIKLGVTWLTKP